MMTDDERDRLLVRLDERTQNIWRSVAKLEEHQELQNGLILDSFALAKSNRTWINVLRITLGSILSAIIAWLCWITKTIGNW